MNIAFNTIVTPARQKIGVGVYIDNLLQNLLALYPQDDFYALVNRHEPAVEFTAQNYYPVKMMARPQPSPLLTAWQPAFARQLKKVRADVYHLPNTAPLLFNSCPTVATILDLQEFRVAKYGRVRTFYRRAANWLISRRADLILTLSENSKRDIQELLHVPADKVRVIYLAPSPAYRQLNRAEAVARVKARYGFENYLITVGDIQAGKNLVRWIETYAALRAAGEVRSLLLVGKETAPYQALHTRIAELGLQGAVHLVGYVSQTDLINLYNAADLCVYPSLYEGFGLPVLEAMACGVPVATSNLSSIPEVAGDAAVLFDPYDVDDITFKVRALLDNSEQLVARSAAGLRQVARFSWQNTARQTMQAYRDVAAQRLSKS